MHLPSWLTSINPQLLSAIIAGLALVISTVSLLITAVMQTRTWRLTRVVALASMNAANRKDWIFNVQKTVAEYLPANYDVNSGFIRYKLRGEWPENIDELRRKEDLLYNQICLLIEPERPSHAEFFKELTALRDDPNRYVERRDALIAAARKMFQAEWGMITSV